MLNDRKKGMEFLTYLASFPPLRTSHFNENGDNKFRQKVQILLFAPSVIGLILVLFMYVTPLLVDDTI